MNPTALRRTAWQTCAVGTAIWLLFFALQTVWLGWTPNEWPSLATMLYSSVASTLSLCSAVLLAISAALALYLWNLQRASS